VSPEIANASWVDASAPPPVEITGSANIELRTTTRIATKIMTPPIRIAVPKVSVIELHLEPG
jgi:hypothetical protein